MIDTLEQLTTLTRSFWSVRIVLSAVELDLFAPITSAPRSAAEVAVACATDRRATEILLDALTSMGLVHKESGAYRASELAARHLSTASPEPMLGMLLHQADLWRRWSHLTEIVRTGTPAPRGDAPRLHESFIQAMHDHKHNQKVSDWLPIDLSGVRRAIDLGGGPGTLAIALAESCPEATVVLFDRPATLEVAARVVPTAFWGSRIRPQAGDLLVLERYGENYDLAILSAVLHAFGEDECARTVQRAADCLAPGGRLLIRETILNPDRAGPPHAALFSVNMLVGTPAGRSYTFEEMARWMTDAGLVDVRRLPGDAIVASKP